MWIISTLNNLELQWKCCRITDGWVHATAAEGVARNAMWMDFIFNFFFPKASLLLPCHGNLFPQLSKWEGNFIVYLISKSFSTSSTWRARGQHLCWGTAKQFSFTQEVLLVKSNIHHKGCFYPSGSGSLLPSRWQCQPSPAAQSNSHLLVSSCTPASLSGLTTRLFSSHTFPYQTKFRLCGLGNLTFILQVPLCSFPIGSL